MDQVVQALLQLSGEIKDMKAAVAAFQKTRVEKFKEAWLDKDEAALVLNISDSTLDKWRNNGVIPHYRILNKIYYKLEDIEQVLNNNKSGGHHGNY